MSITFGELITQIAKKTGYNKNQIAQMLGITRQTLARRIKEGKQDIEHLLEWALANSIDLNWMLLDKHPENGLTGDIVIDNALIKTRKILVSGHLAGQTLLMNIDSFYLSVFPEKPMHQIQQDMIQRWISATDDADFYMILVDGSGNGLFCNKKTHHKFEGSAGDRKILYDWVAPEHQQALRAAIETVRIRKCSVHLEVQGYDQMGGNTETRIWYSAFLAPVLDPGDNSVQGIAVFAGRIDEQIKALDALREILGVRRDDIVHISGDG